MAIKLTKNEQKVQKDRLKQYQRYLPTLQLKKMCIRDRCSFQPVFRLRIPTDIRIHCEAVQQ